MTNKTHPFEQFLCAIIGEPLPSWETAKTALRTDQYRKSDHLMMQGDSDQMIRFVISGLIRLSYEDAAGRRLTKSIIQPGSVFASVAALLGSTASFSAVALNNACVISLPYPVMRQLADSNMAWEKVASFLFMRLAQSKEQREFELLTMSAEQRWQRLCTREPYLVANVSQVELAALIGITPVALSRIKGRNKLASF
jgi:CRP-like cAMP-binding protein